MKKVLSLVLCFALLVSTFSFCMPIMAVELDSYESVAAMSIVEEAKQTESSAFLVAATTNLWYDGGFDYVNVNSSNYARSDDYRNFKDSWEQEIIIEDGGNKAISLAATTIHAPAISNAQSFNLDAEKTYKLSFKIKNRTAGVTSKLQVAYDASSGSKDFWVCTSLETFTASDEWETYEIDLPANANYIYMRSHHDGSQNVERVYTCLDDIIVYESDSENTETVNSKAGINVLTSASGAYAFNNLDAITTESGTVAVAKDPENASNNVVKLTGSSVISHNADSYAIDVSRPVLVKFDYYVSTTEDLCLTINFNGSNIRSYAIDHVDLPANSTIGWNTYSKVIDASAALGITDFTDTSCELKNRPAWKGTETSINKLYISVATARTSTGTPSVYIDNLSLVPLYKVTYDANGAQGSLDPVFTSSSVYTPEYDGSALSRDGYRFLGWSTAANGNPVDVVSFIPGTDTTLFAVWSNSKDTINKTLELNAPIAEAVPQTIVTGTGYTASVTWSPAVTDKFGYDTEYTATVTITPEQFYTTEGIEADSYVVRKATSVRNTANSNVVTVKFPKTQATKGKAGDPGVNILTGTLLPYDFEASDLYNWISGGSFVVKAKDDVATNTAAQLNASGYGQLNIAPTKNNDGNEIFVTVPVVLENDRPYELVFKALGNGNVSLINRWHYPDSAFSSVSMNNADVWTEYSTSFLGEKTKTSADADANQNNRIYFFTHNTGCYIDDISLVPHYKITYDLNGGTGNVLPDYFYDSSYSELDSGESAKKMGAKFLGWAEASDATADDIVTTVYPMIGQDITLYAVWEQAFEGATDVYWDFESDASKVWSANGGVTGTYKNGMYVVDTTNATAGAYITHNALTGDAISTTSIDTFVIKARSNGINELTLSFTTSDSADNTVKITGIESGSTFKEYSVNLSQNANWTGNYVGSKLIVSGGSGTIEIEEMYYTSDYVYQAPNIGAADIEKAVIVTSADAITEDQGTITLTPYVRYGDGSEITDYSGAYYTIDSVSAQVKANADGTATLTGKINGIVDVTVVLTNGIKITKSIEVSGQANRTASTTFKVMMYGNSIRQHGYVESTWPYRDLRGMAATKLENDYAHRFIYYLNLKYGNGAAQLVACNSVAGFEGVVNNNKSNAEFDYTNDLKGFVNEVAAAQPDIITLQIGENVNGTTNAAYQNAMSQFYDALHNAAPDALIIFATPFWTDATEIAAMTSVANNKNIPLAQLHKLDTTENKAFLDFPDAIPGVQVHPGDVGMDNIAKTFFEQANIVLSANEPTVYKATPESLEITAPSNVITQGTLKLTANVFPTDAAQDVTWSSSDENIATVDSETGLVTAVNNGTVTITATSRFVNTVTDEYTVTVSGQTDAFTLTYNKNTTDAVEDMPEANEYASLGFVFDAVNVPTRTGYAFMGWSTEPCGKVVSSIDVTEDTTVYAQWELAQRWYFDTPGNKEGFKTRYGFNEYAVDGYIMAIATDTNVAAGEVLTFISPVLKLDAKNYHTLKFNMQNTDFANDTEIKLTIFTSTGNVELTKPVTTNVFTDYEFSLESVDGTITGFEVIPTNIDATIRINSVEFLTYADALEVSSVKEDLTLDVQSIRFAGYIDDAVKAKVDEFGFIAADASAFADGDNDYVSLVHSETKTFVAANGTYKYNAVATYVKDGVDSIYSTTGDMFGTENRGAGSYYAVSINNITRDHFDSDIVVKTYVKIGEEYIYGTAVRRNVSEVIDALSANN